MNKDKIKRMVCVLGKMKERQGNVSKRQLVLSEKIAYINKCK